MKKFILIIGLMMLGLATITFAANHGMCIISGNQVYCNSSVVSPQGWTNGNDTICYEKGCGACIKTEPQSKDPSVWQCMDNDTDGESYKCDYYGNWTYSSGSTANVIGFDPFDWPFNTSFKESCVDVGFAECLNDTVFDGNNRAPIGAPNPNPIYGIYGRCAGPLGQAEEGVPETNVIVGIVGIIVLIAVVGFFFVNKKT